MQFVGATWDGGGKTQQSTDRSVTCVPALWVWLLAPPGSGFTLQEEPGPRGVTEGQDTEGLLCYDGVLLSRSQATFVAVGWPGPSPGLLRGCHSLKLESA